MQTKWIIRGALVVVFGIFAAVVFAAYQERFGGSGDPILVRAPETPLKRTPDERGGLEVANEDTSVADVLQRPAQPVQPEQILPSSEPAEVEPAEVQPEQPVQANETIDTTAVEPEPVEPTAEEVQEMLPEPELPEPPLEVESLEAEDDQPPLLVRPTPPPRPAPDVAEPEPLVDRDLDEGARDVAEVREELEPAAPPPAAPAPQTGGDSDIAFRLQLGAFGSDIAARLAWAAYRERFGEVIADLSPHIARSTGSEPVYRLQAGPFPDRDSANSVCSSVKERGGDCFVVAAN